MDDEYISQVEAAKRLDVHPSTIGRWGKAGKIDAYSVAGRPIYLAEEIDELAHQIDELGRARP